MKKHLLVLAACSLLLLVAGCKKEEGNNPDSLNGNEARPSWVAPDEYDMTSSMTAVIRVDLAAQYPTTATDFVVKDDDLLAAFMGNDCVGVAALQDGLFYLYIAGQTSEGGDGMVTLRYYSAHYKNLFTAANAFTFVNDGNQGTVASPFIPSFAVDAKK